MLSFGIFTDAGEQGGENITEHLRAIRAIRFGLFVCSRCA
jgi:hypothetical protein